MGPEAPRADLNAVWNNFKSDIDYTMLQKIYGTNPDGHKRYSPSECLGIKKVAICGRPDPKHISTSYVERSNVAVRMGMRRFTRLTNGFSKKVENHMRNIDLFFAYYNFCRVHLTLGTTLAVAAGLAPRALKIEDLVKLLD